MQFLSECALLGPSRLRSLRKFLPESELAAVGGESWEYHFVKNPHTKNGTPFLEKEKRLAAALYGAFTTAEGFVKRGMLAHAELMTGEIEYARANPACHGF